MSIKELLTATDKNAELVELILCDRYFGLSKAGNARMQQLMQQPGADEAFVLCECYLDLQALSQEVTDEQVTLMTKQLREKGLLLTLLVGAPVAATNAAPVKRIFFQRWHSYAAGLAAAVAGIYFFVKQPENTPSQPPKHPQTITAIKDIPPGKDKAILTLANGDTVLLGEQQQGDIATEGNTKLINLSNGLLAYEAANNGSTEPKAMVYNSIATPRAGKFALELKDGTKVWLNAASSLRYPVAFTGKERIVELAGEAYFEVAANARQPFIVKAGSQTVNVLGTHFNISAYPEDKTVNTTLLEGSVRVTNGEVAQYLNPGQQAQASKTTTAIQLSAHPDLEDVMAWKNGIFYLNGSSLEHLMLQVGRWYNMEVEYVHVNKSAGRFMGTIPRDVPLSQVLYLLELTGSMHFTVEGQKILVRQ